MPTNIPTRILILAGCGVMVLLILFDVSFDPQFALPAEVELPDADQEGRFHACVGERDAEIHRIAFSTIDNPDVQREYLSAQKALAVAGCRALHPERRVAVSRPLRVNLIDLEFRF